MVRLAYIEPCVAQGEYCARKPCEVLIGCCVAVLILSLGLVRFRVETDPQRLWVGRGSRALRDKQAYEVRCQPGPMQHVPIMFGLNKLATGMRAAAQLWPHIWRALTGYGSTTRWLRLTTEAACHERATRWQDPEA